MTWTKTMGPGKKIQQLQMFITIEACIEQQEWMQVGFRLWASTDQNPDFFLGIQTPDLKDMRIIEARYTDGLAMGRATLTRLEARASSAH